MANKQYYKTIKTHDADFEVGRAGTPYYHNSPASQELYKAAKFAKKWVILINELFEISPETSTWWIHHWQEVRRNARAGKGSKRTPQEAVAELYDLMDKGLTKWMATTDYGMPAPCWDKWNRVIQEGFDKLGRTDFDYADAMKVEWIQTHDGKKPLIDPNGILQ